MPSKNVAAISSSKGGHPPVCLVILDNDWDVNRFLYEKVVSTSFKNTHALFLLTGNRLFHRGNKKLSQCGVVVYPDSTKERTLFWEKLSTLIGMF